MVEFKQKSSYICVDYLKLSHSIAHAKPAVHPAMAVLQLCLLALFVVGTKSTYMFSNTIVVHNGNYNVSYHYNESADTLEFLVEVRTTGWVGFGFALNAPTGMQNYDVAVGGVLSNGSGYLKVRSIYNGAKL